MLWIALLVILLLMTAIIVISLPSIYPDGSPFLDSDLRSAVRGLLGAVLLFNVYAIQQQWKFKQLQNQLATQAELAMEQKAYADAYYQLSIVDPLTNLFNRRHGESRLQVELERADKLRTPLLVLIFDIGASKQDSARLGHNAADVLLQEFARCLQKATRGSDFAVRMDGDQFMVVLCDCRLESLQMILSRLYPCEVDLQGTKLRVSASWGWAQHEHGETARELIYRAYNSLLERKGAGNLHVAGADSPAFQDV